MTELIYAIGFTIAMLLGCCWALCRSANDADERARRWDGDDYVPWGYRGKR